MPVTSLHVSGYRSLRDFSLPMQQVNVITGANGTGKSNLYQALMLAARVAHGQFARAIAEEGGTPSILWAGGERIRYTRKKPAKRFSMSIEPDSFGFSFSIGLPSPSSLPPGKSLFGFDPEVKEEKLWLGKTSSRVLMLDRRRPTTWLRNAEGQMDEYAFALLKYESVLPQIVEPHRYPEVGMLARL
jgi:predicted ATPase